MKVLLHKGSSGLVQVAKDGDELVVVKVMEISYVCKRAKQVVREITNHLQLSAYKHPFILELKRVTLISQQLVLVLENFIGV